VPPVRLIVRETEGERVVSEPDGELTIVTLRFDAARPERLLGVLSKYVVLTRMHDGCRNVDLCASVTTPGRYLVIEKWATAGAQRAHFDSPDMVEMAEACRGLLARPPDIDLLEGISAHDLR
jgi:quinol monooxygenase YgiN